jgi:hypothetical protein
MPNRLFSLHSVIGKRETTRNGPQVRRTEFSRDFTTCVTKWFEPIVSFAGSTLKDRSSYRFDYSNEFLLMVKLSQLNERISLWGIMQMQSAAHIL